MKFRVTLKDPDCLYEPVNEAASMRSREILDLTNDERLAVYESTLEQLRTLTDKWFEYGEYLTVEIDTVAETCTVVNRR